VSSFFGEVFFGLLSCFSSLSSVRSLTRKISFHRDLDFGHSQDTKLEGRTGQKTQSGVNFPFYNRDIWAKKAFFLLFPELLLEVSPAKALVLTFPCAAQKTVMTDLDKTFRQNM
jgi:hypothetical protein